MITRLVALLAGYPHEPRRGHAQGSQKFQPQAGWWRRRIRSCYNAGTTAKTLALAIDKAKALPEAAQEQLGREMLERIDALADLRAAIEVGIRELDAGMGEQLDIEDVIREARAGHARG